MHLLEHQVSAYIKQHQLITSGDKLLVACSGGVDSMALLSFLYKFQHYFKIKLFVAHVDHMLRGEASEGDRNFVEQICAKWEIPVFSCAIPIAEYLEKEGGNSQAICRRERYRFFEKIMTEQKIDKLVTAHHADDQLESMLMAITKASSLNGLKGIVPKRPFLNYFVIRPFLAVTKSEIGEYLHTEGQTYREDASNEKDTYTRNRFRHHVVPLLKRENPSISHHVVQLADQIAEDDRYLMQLAETRFSTIFKEMRENCYKVVISDFQREPLALQRRFILILLKYLYHDSKMIQSYALCTSILKLFDTSVGSSSVNLPEDYIARQQYGEIVFEKNQQPRQLTKQKLALNEWNSVGELRVYIGALTQCEDSLLAMYQPYYFTASAIQFPLFVRIREDGDRIALSGMQQKKKVARIFIDGKIPLVKRAHWPLLVDANNELLAVMAVRVNNQFSDVRLAAHDSVLLVAHI
ncbi:tRNA lysidine(34) synthetase TilS [Solibacillus sp. R5-41]|uniref:tRNA lysidine(34) synthetase TilS n=1 Tax=Solibacillus sp. R5-41 TaxID=2048654 RepID=UPI000C1251A1|nr:tRNA lysidine(34) synthetase TilS [Solibacillus sp. R5-41]ATP38627.1 tRNA lysidine(34) synthetase TilS [Solibacillus sp. R5-41]